MLPFYKQQKQGLYTTPTITNQVKVVIQMKVKNIMKIILAMLPTRILL